MSKFDDYDFSDEQARQAELATGNPYLQDPSKAMGLLARLCGRPDGTTADEVAKRLARLKELVHERFPEVVEQSDYQGEARAYDELLRMERELEELALFPDLATRHVIGVGGSFSAGKSRFLNTLLDIDLLPEDVRPTTAVPTYLVTGSERDDIEAINTFSRRISLSTDELEALSHEFGSAHGQGAQLRLAELLKYLLVRRHADGWNRLAFLDTPGYSKAESSDEATADKAVARTQLASADHLLWLLDTSNGSIRQDDIDFLSGLQHTGELFVVLTHADLLSKSQAEQVAQIVRKRLSDAGLTIQGLMAWSAPPEKNYGERVLGDDVRLWLDKLNQKPKLTTKRNKLRRLFSGYIDHHRERVEETQMSLRVFNALSPWHHEMDSSLRDDLGKMRKTQQKAQRLNKRLIGDLEKLQSEMLEQADELLGGAAVADESVAASDRQGKLSKKRRNAPSSKVSSSSLTRKRTRAKGKNPIGGHIKGGLVYEREGEVRSLVFSPDGKLLASSGQDDSIELWDTSWKERTATLRTDERRQRIAISPDGTFLVSAATNGRMMRCWSLPDGSLIAEEKLARSFGRIVDLSFSQTGNAIFLAVDGKFSKSIPITPNALADVRRVVSRGQLSLFYFIGQTRAIATSPDGDMAATLGGDKCAWLWSISKGKRVLRIPIMFPVGIAFSSADNYIAVGNFSGCISLFRFRCGSVPESFAQKNICPSKGGRASIRSVAFSPDGRSVVSGNENGKVQIWDVRSAKCIATYKGHQGTVTALTCSLDGRYVASGGADHTVRLWRAPWA